MHILLCGGSGFIGQALSEHLINKGHQVVVVTRDVQAAKRRIKQDMPCVLWQDINSTMIQDFDVVINLAGANIAKRRWSDAYKKELYDSRINTAERIKICLEPLGQKAPRWFNASAIGFYGFQEPDDHLPEAIDEQTDAKALDQNGFSSKLVAAWEKIPKEANKKGVPITLLRFGVVMAKHDGALKKMLGPFKMGVGGRVGSGRQVMSWVALVDVVRAIAFLLEQPNLSSGPINVVAPLAIKQIDFAKALAKSLHRPCLLPMPSPAVKLLFGQMGEELLLNGVHITPSVLNQLGFKFKCPSWQTCLDHQIKFSRKKG